MNMKEGKPIDLTSVPQKRILNEDGDIFMAENGEGPQAPKQPEGNNAKNPREEKIITPEEKQKINNAWQTHNSLRTSEGEKISVDEMRTQEMLKEKGFMPPLTQEAKDLLKNVDEGLGPSQFTARLERILRENGITQEDINSKNTQELFNILRSSRVPEQNTESQGKQNPVNEGENNHKKEAPEAKAPGDKPKEQKNINAEDDLFSQTPNIPDDEAELERIAKKDLEASGITKSAAEGSKIAQDVLELRKQQLRNTRDFIKGVEMETRAFGKGPAQSLSEIIQGVKTGRINAIDAEPYIQRYAEIAAKQKQDMGEQAGREWREIIGNLESKTGYEKTKALKDVIRKLNPDMTIPDEFFELVAKDDEASEQLVSKIVYKPFATPEAEYSLSFYASINFESFLTVVGNVEENVGSRKSSERRQNYKEQHEMALRLHEANKAIVTQSANIDGLMNIARTITPERLQTGIELDGVEQARQICELAFGRLYANYDRLQAQRYQTEIADWAKETFVSEMPKAGIKSRFEGPDKKLRNLEDWELERAFGLGRNYQATLLRVPELVSWGNIPKPSEEWLRSPTSETLARIIGGFKMLQGRFRSGVTKGGPTYVHLINHDAVKNYKGLSRIGVLDVKKELIPLSLFSAGGFEKGWRPVGSYLNTPFMKIDISRIPEALRQMRSGGGEPERIFKKYLEEQKHNDQSLITNPDKSSTEVNLGEFLVYNTGLLQEELGQDIEIKGIKIPKEITQTDYGKSKLLMEDMFLPLMGFTLKPKKVQEFNAERSRIEKYEAKGLSVKEGEKARKDLFSGHFEKNEKGEDVYEYDYFKYNQKEDQVNFSLGLLLSTGGVSSNIRILIWQKVADIMPLRIAQFLSEEGVKNLPGYEKVKGEKLSDGGTRLFKKDFENKLIRLHMIRMQEQKKVFEVTNQGRRHEALRLSDYFEAAGLTQDERQFVKKLQKLGREKASELAQVDYPHVAFLDDVPFQKSEYGNLGPEVYARRMNDERGYSEARDAAGGVVEHIGGSWGEIKKHLKEMEGALSGPEGSFTAQNVAYKLIKPYFMMAEQFGRAKIPGYKPIAEFLNIPTSHLQRLFSTNAPSWNVRELSVNIRDLAADDGILRNEKMPGEKKSQVSQLLTEFNAQPFKVAWSEFLNALMMWMLFSLAALPSKIKDYGKR